MLFNECENNRFNFGKIYKYLKVMTEGHYDLIKPLSYNRPFLVVSGSRNLGKSTTCAIAALLTYVVCGKKTFYTRRTNKDLVDTYQTFFTNAVEIYNFYQSTVFKDELPEIIAVKPYARKYLIAFEKDENDKPIWEEFGNYLALSDEQNIKSACFGDTVILLYDECIATSDRDYLGVAANGHQEEYDKLMSLYQTIDRTRFKAIRNETLLICLGNKASIYNPIFIQAGIVDYVQPPNCPQPKFTAPKDQPWIWQDIDEVDATKNAKKSFAFMMANKQTRDYAYNNIGIDKTEFVRRAVEPTIYDRTVRIRGKEYGISHTRDYMFYIDNPKPGYAVQSLDHTSHDGTDSEMLINPWTRDPVLLNVADAYRRGKLYFKDGLTQNVFLAYLDFKDR